MIHCKIDASFFPGLLMNELRSLVRTSTRLHGIGGRGTSGWSAEKWAGPPIDEGSRRLLRPDPRRKVASVAIRKFYWMSASAMLVFPILLSILEWMIEYRLLFRFFSWAAQFPPSNDNLWVWELSFQLQPAILSRPIDLRVQHRSTSSYVLLLQILLHPGISMTRFWIINHSEWKKCSRNPTQE